MKKVALCIGVFMAFFFLAGVYTAQAQDLTDFNGAWLKLTVNSKKGLEFIGLDSTSAPEKLLASESIYFVCVDVDEAAPTPAYLRFFNKQGTAIGSGALYWDAGTNLEFLGYLEASLATDVSYVPGDDGFPGVGSFTDTYLYGYVKVKGPKVEKIEVKSVSGEGYIQAPDATETTGRYVGFGYSFSGGFTTSNKIPIITPACGEMVFPPAP